MLGGMPRVIKLYLDSEKLLICREAQVSLLNSYRDDFLLICKQKVQQRYCERVFSKSFELVAKHFKYTDIDPDMDYRMIKIAISLLFKAIIFDCTYILF